jgi:hypothetical protein
MANSVSNFCVNSDFNPNFDITWSFQYAISGKETTSGGITYPNGGFSTFLFQNAVLSGGGPLSGLGYSNYLTNAGVSGAVLGITFESSYDTGKYNEIIRILKGTTFNILTSVKMHSQLSPFIRSAISYKTIRFNLTNIGRTLNISVKNSITNNYEQLYTYDVNLNIGTNDKYKIGIGFAAPLPNKDDNKIILKLKDLQYQGIVQPPDTTTTDKPTTIPQPDTFYVLRSPLSGKIPIGDPDPTVSGFILHNS